ncbi:MAG TPA: hypothetical protein VFE09_08430 [Rubrobacteraceae bacterium]|nr:hypothetical protein [Rubrobacteraceae bacterium]
MFASRGSRPVVAALVSMLMVGLLTAGCAGPRQEEKSAPPVAGHFVGATSDPDTFVVVVADEAEQGEDQRTVKAYLGDGYIIDEWFTDTVSGDSFDLTSDGGARLMGELSSDAASGTATLSNGASVSFEATPATGFGGLYNVSFYNDGRVSGTSERGGQLEGQIGSTPRPDGLYPITGTITSPDDRSQNFEAVCSTNQAADIRLIALASGQMRGGKNFGTTF